MGLGVFTQSGLRACYLTSVKADNSLTDLGGGVSE